ncbi:MAG: outer membrane beta-barrel protein [Desulfobacterales bacterium]|nr:outer membrane beta-barrel protein [Desulfobacterales bacterium]
MIRFFSPFIFSLAVLLYLAVVGSNAYAGPKRFQWSTRISVSETYDDNINLEKDNKEDDWITSITPGLTLTIMTEETEVNLDYDLSFVSYARNEENNTVRHSLTLSGLKGIPIAEHITLDLDESFQVSEDPIEISEYVTSERRSRERYYRNTAGGRINYHFGEGDFFYAGFHHILLENDDPSLEDSQQYRPMAGFTYWFDIRNGVSLDYSYTRGEFDVSEDFDQHRSTATYTHRFSPRTQTNLSYSYDSFDYEGIKEDYVVHSSSLGLSHQLTEQVSGSISGGYYVQDREHSDDTSGFTGDASLDGTFRFEKGALTLNSSTGYRQQYFEAENLGFSKYRRASATLTYRPLEKLTTSLSGSYWRDDYQETAPERKDNTWQSSAGLSYRLFRWLSGSLSYQYRQMDSSIGANDYIDNRVTLTLTASYLGKPRFF